ncbi:MAG TPA: hypothetical protein VHB97_09065 [Polyangia bacterium]|nr:hypothetical protein [Polyangia bacterium]
MDYYAAWPAWKVPKWLGAMLGGIFTIIIVGCAWMIVDLTRPPRPRVAVVPAATAPTQPKIVEPARPAPAVAAVTPPAAAPAAAAAPVAAATPVAAAAPVVVAAKSAKKHSSPARKHAVLAKKSDLDRLLGL